MPGAPLNTLLQTMMEKEASDLYLTVNSAPMLGVHGDFVAAHPTVLTQEDTQQYAFELMTDRERNHFEEELEVNLSHTIGEKGRFRVNIYTQRNHVALVIRRIVVDIPSLATLGLPESLGGLMMLERGLVLVTGATGTGKSTTVAAMIDYRNERKGGHIITIEDPVEFVHPHKKCLISQREVGIDTKSFHIALKNSLRQAPKIIYIGEVRDTETMKFCLHAAETGHLVVGTLHSNNSTQALERISNFFDHDFQEQLRLQLSLNLRAVVSQRLLKCGTGARVAALEILLNTPSVSELIQKGEIKSLKSTIEEHEDQGLQSFDMHIHQLWKQGLVTEEEAFAHAESANNLRLRMRGVRMSGV